jgi:hypothetical protein
MEKPSNDNHIAGGLDIEEGDLYRNETDREICRDEPDTLDPDDLPSLDVVRAALRYGRDSCTVKSDVNPDEDNYAPGVLEQD